MDARHVVEKVGAYIDHRHPRVVRAVLGARWGGLRTVELDPTGWSALLGVGAVAGVTTRAVVRRARAEGPPAVRPLGAVGAVALGGLGAWFVLWRWDTRRWRRRHASLEVDLPARDLEVLAAQLREVAAVETWEDPVGVGGARRGLLVPVKDLRAVNAALGEAHALRRGT